MHFLTNPDTVFSFLKTLCLGFDKLHQYSINITSQDKSILMYSLTFQSQSQSQKKIKETLKPSI